MWDNDNPLSLKNLLAGILVTLIGGVILAWIIQDARFAPASEPISTSSTNSVKTDTQVTEGGFSKDYSVSLGNGEILVGHADTFQNYEGCVAYLIVGPAVFDFSIKSGLWDKWINVTPDLHNGLLKEQSDTLVNKYSCTPVKIVVCDPQCKEAQ